MATSVVCKNVHHPKDIDAKQDEQISFSSHPGEKVEMLSSKVPVNSQIQWDAQVGDEEEADAGHRPAAQMPGQEVQVGPGLSRPFKGSQGEAARGS